MNYQQLALVVRYMLAALREQGFNQSQITQALGRHHYHLHNQP